MISAISSATTAATNTESEIDASGGLSTGQTLDQQEFLTLFITQLQNQDPLNPLDTNGLTDQLAQFSSLEQLFNINTNLEAMGEALDSGEATAPLSFLGAEVSARGGTIAVEDGEATPVTLDILGDATSVDVTIVGPTGDEVRKIALGSQPAGQLDFAFDGKDERGAAVPNGSYTVSVAATDGNGDPLSVEPFTWGTVTGIDLTAEPPLLLVGARRVSLADVQEVRSGKNEGEGT